jgi:hypothetical protein
MSNTTNLANGGWIPASDDDDIVCECEAACTTYKGCPCQQIDCPDDECGSVRGCLEDCACMGECD